MIFDAPPEHQYSAPSSSPKPTAMAASGKLLGGDADSRSKPPKMTRMTCSTRSLYLLPAMAAEPIMPMLDLARSRTTPATVPCQQPIRHRPEHRPPTHLRRRAAPFDDAVQHLATSRRSRPITARASSMDPMADPAVDGRSEQHLATIFHFPQISGKTYLPSRSSGQAPLIDASQASSGRRSNSPKPNMLGNTSRSASSSIPFDLSHLSPDATH
ncbi:hypothetical protein ACLOJK_006509 [Asimina triloba]